MPDRYLPCPVKDCDHEERIPAQLEEGEDSSYTDLWDHVAQHHADRSARRTGDLMATAQVIER